MAEDFDFEHSNPKEVYRNDEGIGLSGEHKAWLESNFHEFVNKRKYRFRGKFNLNILDLENEIRRWNNAYGSFICHASINPEIIYESASEIFEERSLFHKQIRDIAEKIVYDEHLKLLN
jgi:hypothetical protein